MAKRAPLTAKASMFQEQQAWQQEELRLQQRQQELALKPEISKAKAEECALAEAEAGISVQGAKEGFPNLAPTIKVESCLTKEPRESQQPPIRIIHYPVAEVNGKECWRHTFEDRESQYSTSTEEGLCLLMDCNVKSRNRIMPAKYSAAAKSASATTARATTASHYSSNLTNLKLYLTNLNFPHLPVTLSSIATSSEPLRA